MVKISAVICTHNRQDYLVRAIESLLAQDFPDSEIILVNNASTDGTADLAQNYTNHPQFRYIYEPVLGLSTARNTGAVAAQGEIIAYLDDDAVASPGWLRVLSTAFTEDQKLAIAGGKVTLLLPEDQLLPWWISPSLASNLGAYDLGNEKVDIHQPGLTPRGLNYAIRKQFWRSMGGFAVNLGRKGKNLLSNEEVHATEVALRQGWRVAYLPEAIVAHQVVPERLKPQWFLHRAWWQGISEYQYQQVTITHTPQELKAAAQRMLRGGYKSLKYLLQPSLSFENLVYTYGQLGYFSAVIAGLGGKDLP
jgi:glycosyltransferase involved in cell wall biosynthesis